LPPTLIPKYAPLKSAAFALTPANTANTRAKVTPSIFFICWKCSLTKDWHGRL